MTLPAALTDPERVNEAIERAKRSAAERKVPLTVERLAACLQVEPADIREAVRQAKAGRGGRSSRRRAGEALKEVCAECRAVLMEQGLARSSSPVLPMFGLKVHFGYTDRPEEDGVPSVRFEGEDAIME
ncbi:MAG TPA: hypothetical protein H9684_09085 [Firmicutes bacterium]|nr:hypothetical protein [Bacillota bacterium]